MARTPYYEQVRYWGKVVGQQLGVSSNDNPQIVITFQVLGKLNPEDPDGELLSCGEHYDRSIFLTVTSRTIEWVTRDLEQLGFDGNSFSQLDLNASDCCDLRGKEIAFTCKHEPHYKTGEPREKWNVANDSDGLQIKSLDAKGVRQLDAMFGKHLKKPAGAKPAASQPSPTLAEKAERLSQPAETATPEDIDKLHDKTDEALAGERGEDIPF